MRSISSTLNTAQNLRNRHPLARVTVRDTRLRFGPFTGITNPWSLTDGFQVEEQDHCPGDLLLLESGTIIRAWSANTNMYVQRITTPGTAANWSHATNAWTDLGFEPTNYSNPSLVEDTSTNPNTLYLFYQRSLGGIRYRTSTDDGATWSAESSVGESALGDASISAVTKDEVYVCWANNGVMQIDRLVNSAGWTKTSMPWKIHGNTTNTLIDHSYDSVTFFDTFSLNSVTWIVYSFGPEGVAWITSYDQGIWGEPRLLIPDDYTAFHPYRASVIQGTVWLTGRFERDNESDYSPAFDGFLYSNDGENWTALARDSYIGNAALRGQLVLSGNYVYYPGLSSVLRAPATYLIDPASDPETIGSDTYKLILGPDTGSGELDDLVNLGISFPPAGSVPSADIELATNDDRYLTGAYTDAIKPGSEVWIEAGYITSVGNEYASLLRANIDSVPTAVADGTRNIGISARGSDFKRLRDYVSPFYWELYSQRKHYDDCLLLDKFTVEAGTWEFEGANLLSNPNFEDNTTGWSAYTSGTATGTRTRTTDEQNTGRWSYANTKSGGATTDDYGVSATFSAEAGKTYRIEANIRVSYISGGELKTTLKVSGNYGEAAAADSEEASWSEATDYWETLTVTVTTITAATLTVAVYLDDCTSGTVYIDDVTAVDTTPSYFSYSDQDDEGVLLSVTGNQFDFDIRGRFTDQATTTATSFNMGLVGLAKDEFNLVALRLVRISSGTYIMLHKRRAGNWTLLGSASYSWSANTAYDLRLVHRGGQFWGYVKAASSSDWGAAQINYTWSSTTGDVPCPTANGRGRVGLYSKIRPRQFHAYQIDDHSKQILLRVSNDLDWDSFTNSGTIRVDDEIMTFTGRTQYVDSSNRGPTTVFGDTFTYNLGRSCNPIWGDVACPPGSTARDITAYGWTHWGNWGVPWISNNYYTDWGIVFRDGDHPGGTWLIESDLDHEGEHIFTTDYVNSGHENVHANGGGDPIPHATNWSHTDGCHLAPCLYGLTRGASGSIAAAHAENSLAFQFCDDVTRVSHFELYDFEPDWNNERLLQRLCSFTGQLGVEFDSAFSGGPYTLTGTNYDGEFLGTFNNRDVDLSFDWSHNQWGVGASRVGAVLHASTQDMATFTGHIIYLSYFSGTYRVNFSTRAAGVETGLHTWHLESGAYPVGTGTHSMRIVSTGHVVTLYCNGRLLGSFYDDSLADQTDNYVAVLGKESTLTVTNVRIPELYEWREFVQVDDGTSLQGAIGKVLEDRPVFAISRSGETIKFATFDTRDDLGTFSDSVYSDSQTPEDGEIFTFTRIVSEDIIEQIDETLAREHGLIHHQLQMPEASTDNAAAQFTRLNRRMQEVVYGRSETMVGNLKFENEDKLTLNVTVSGTGLVISNEPLIVNDIRYNIGAAEFSMQINTRKFIS